MAHNHCAKCSTNLLGLVVSAVLESKRQGIVLVPAEQPGHPSCCQQRFLTEIDAMVALLQIRLPPTPHRVRKLLHQRTFFRKKNLAWLRREYGIRCVAGGCCGGR